MSYQPLGSAPGCIDSNEAEWLYTQALKVDSIVEIGCWVGKSTHALLSGCKGLVYAVDHFKGSAAKHDATYNQSGKEEFLKNCRHFSNLRLMEMFSHEAFEKVPEVDMGFIDAGHEFWEVLLDLALWVPKVKKFMCGHDITHYGVEKALRHYLGNSWERVGVGSLWIWRR